MVSKKLARTQFIQVRLKKIESEIFKNGIRAVSLTHGWIVELRPGHSEAAQKVESPYCKLTLL